MKSHRLRQTAPMETENLSKNFPTDGKNPLRLREKKTSLIFLQPDAHTRRHIY